MIQVTIKNLAGVITNQAQFQTQADADAWVTAQVALKSFGKPERWVDAEDISSLSEDRAQAVASQQVGGPEDERTQYKFSAEYTVEQKDITEEVAQEKLSQDSIQCLRDTDWYVTRLVETNHPIPAEVSLKRSEARAAIKKA